jgi:hypothetical protein
VGSYLGGGDHWRHSLGDERDLALPHDDHYAGLYRDMQDIWPVRSLDLRREGLVSARRGASGGSARVGSGGGATSDSSEDDNSPPPADDGRTHWRRHEFGANGTHSTEFYADEAVRVIEEHDAAEGLFLYLVI